MFRAKHLANGGEVGLVDRPHIRGRRRRCLGRPFFSHRGVIVVGSGFEWLRWPHKPPDGVCDSALLTPCQALRRLEIVGSPFRPISRGIDLCHLIGVSVASSADVGASVTISRCYSSLLSWSVAGQEVTRPPTCCRRRGRPPSLRALKRPRHTRTRMARHRANQHGRNGNAYIEIARGDRRKWEFDIAPTLARSTG